MTKKTIIKIKYKNQNKLIQRILFLGFMLIQACQLENEVLDSSPSEPLQFSTDTVFFDTILTTTPSLTKRLTVYNPNKKAVELDEISILNPRTPFTLTVNGQKNTRFRKIRLFGKDSLRIFIETQIQEQDEDLPFLIHDSLRLVLSNREQFVNLVGWGQDAHFLNQEVLQQNTFWEGSKPYVIYGSLLVDTLTTLVIQEGVQIYMSYESAIYIKGSLKILGSNDKPVIIRNIRNDQDYQNAFGQWVGIYFLEGTFANEIENARIRNGVFGLRVGSPDNNSEPEVTLKNTVIENMQTYGIVGFTSDIYAENVLINNCIDGTFAGLAGGNYTLRHCTLSNAGSRFFRESPSVTFSNFILDESNQLFNPEGTFVELENCIIWGSLEEEFQLLHQGNQPISLSLQHNLLKTQQKLENGNNILNENPKFKNPNEYDFQLDTLSPAKDQGKTSIIKIDLLHQSRDSKPDLGAYERIE